MGNYKKGIEARSLIIQQACQVYNEHGLGLTLDQLAKKLDITKGRITNYFPTKDQLFVAISEEYEIAFRNILQNRPPGSMVSMRNLADRVAQIMDLQYQYRSAILFNAVASSEQKEMMAHITSSYANNRATMKASIERLIAAGLVTEVVLEPKHYDVFVFKLTNLFTTWIINLSIYDADRGYEASKPIYLEGILSCYEPYLTAKGKREYRAVIGSLQDSTATAIPVAR